MERHDEKVSSTQERDSTTYQYHGPIRDNIDVFHPSMLLLFAEDCLADKL